MFGSRRPPKSNFCGCALEIYSFPVEILRPGRAVGPVAQWITRLTMDQKIPGSNPGRIGAFRSAPSPVRGSLFAADEERIFLKNS